MSKKEIQKMFEGCHSNLETPLMGTVITPICHQCKNLVWPDDPFRKCTCKVFGELPAKYWSDDKELCPHKST